MFRWFVIVALVAFSLLAGVVIGSISTEEKHPTFNGISATSQHLITSGAVKQAVNEYRVANGLAELASNGSLDSSAQSRADFLCSQNVWSHDGWLSSLAAYVPTASKAGENLEYGNYTQDVRYVVALWSNSPKHNENMLDPQFQEQGMGMTYCQEYQGRKEVVIIVNHFGRPR